MKTSSVVALRVVSDIAATQRVDDGGQADQAQGEKAAPFQRQCTQAMVARAEPVSAVK